MDLAVQISTRYFEFGCLLLEDRNGNTVTALEHQHQRDCCKINTEIVRLWRDGRGKFPKEWSTLVMVISDIGLERLARDIENATSKCK